MKHPAPFLFRSLSSHPGLYVGALTMYTAPLSKTLQKYSVEHHLYTDDTHI